MQPARGTDRGEELLSLAKDLGSPVCESVHLPRGGSGTDRSAFPLSSRRTAEIVLVVPRPGAKVLLHSKDFYPAGLYRLPTGGLHKREPIADGLRREGLEETGNALAPKRFLFAIEYTWDYSAKRFESFGFLMEAAEGPIISQDAEERILGFLDADRVALERYTRQLEGLSGRWSAWGKFRAVPHRILLGLWPGIPELAGES
ncbi:MAG: NUDIX hydrolase [Candidatus Eisenbacteria bacterium]|nr:NUDIX hydrolase [Candidatus Eisenbacteria bacterium]